MRGLGILAGVACLVAAACGGSDDGVESDVRESAACGGGRAVQPGDYVAVNDVDGAGQKYWTVVPNSYDGGPLPVHMILGSGGGSADTNYEAWRPFLDADDGLVVIVGTGLDTDRSVDTFEALVDQLGEDYCIDLDRIHLSGSSSSAHLTALLMCEMPDTFASFADGGGSFMQAPVHCPTPKPLVAMTGDVDRENVERSVESWAEINGCEPEPTAEDLGSGITRFTYERCDADVVFYDLEGMGHAAPMKRCVGPAVDAGVCAEYADFDSFDVWNDFFAEHPLE